MPSEEFVVYGVDDSYTELSRHSSSDRAREWMLRYVRNEGAGGWHRIEVYDERGEDHERLFVWDADSEQ